MRLSWSTIPTAWAWSGLRGAERSSITACSSASISIPARSARRLAAARAVTSRARALFIDSLIQRSRPHLFSNAVPPSVAAAALEAIRILEKEPERAGTLRAKAELFRKTLKSKGIAPLEGEGAIVPVVVGESVKSKAISQDLLAGGLLATSFSFLWCPRAPRASASRSRNLTAKRISTGPRN